MVQRVSKKGIRPINTALTPMHLRAKHSGNLMGNGLTRARQRQNDWLARLRRDRFHSHGSAPFVSKIIEKYGAFSGASASGNTTSSGSVARST